MSARVAILTHRLILTTTDQLSSVSRFNRTICYDFFTSDLNLFPILGLPTSPAVKLNVAALRRHMAAPNRRAHSPQPTLDVIACRSGSA